MSDLGVQQGLRGLQSVHRAQPHPLSHRRQGGNVVLAGAVEEGRAGRLAGRRFHSQAEGAGSCVILQRGGVQHKASANVAWRLKVSHPARR